jgi:hypothetical protein
MPFGAVHHDQEIVRLCRLTDYAAWNVNVLARVLSSGVGAA